MKVNFVEKRSYAEVNTLLENGSVDRAFICGCPYPEGHDEFGLEFLAALIVDGKISYYSYIIINENSKIEKFKDLREKIFAFVNPFSNIAKLVPAYMLQKLGEAHQSFFKNCSYRYSHENSIKTVAQGVIDGTAVDSLIRQYMNRKDYKYIKTR